MFDSALTCYRLPETKLADLWTLLTMDQHYNWHCTVGGVLQSRLPVGRDTLYSEVPHACFRFDRSLLRLQTTRRVGTTLTPTRANATRNIHRRHRLRRWFVNVIGGIYRGRPMNAFGRRTLRYRRRSRQRSSIVAADERSRSNWRTSQNLPTSTPIEAFVPRKHIVDELSRTPNEIRSTPIEAKITPRNLALRPLNILPSTSPEKRNFEH
ncbi:hypothetical protein LSAT2_017750 [Lamellibrachia satsuma]|nr:hypothetical protein LSAT2_017750 [Lamellibrachia satsuma]